MVQLPGLRRAQQAEQDSSGSHTDSLLSAVVTEVQKLHPACWPVACSSVGTQGWCAGFLGVKNTRPGRLNVPGPWGLSPGKA